MRVGLSNTAIFGHLSGYISINPFTRYPSDYICDVFMVSFASKLHTKVMQKYTCKSCACVICKVHKIDKTYQAHTEHLAYSITLTMTLMRYTHRLL